MGILKKALGLAAIGAVAAWVSGKKRKDDAAMWEDVGFAGESRSHGSWQESAGAGAAESAATSSSTEATPSTKSKPSKTNKATGASGTASSDAADQTEPEGGTA